ncbi:MAG: SGNH/GDSL hydrolase family protein, partial [Opitutales bacterium]|nr:SGNH/GDSL hydrolase family protein [Opitutales bacterium]
MRSRRTFIKQSLATSASLPILHTLKGQHRESTVTSESYLRSILYTREEVRAWLEDGAFPFARYSSEFGWLLPDGYFKDGVDDSISKYTYEPNDGPRQRIHYADLPCRINTYGDSFTQCHQVSDGETWQEVLAAHLQEPIRNFGIGGWSVYQAYLRMLKEEKETPADVIIFNIYDDDHFRNLDSWRNIRVNKHERFTEPPLPHLVVNPAKGAFKEMPNPCPTEESLYNLCDYNWVRNRFKNDFALGIEVAHLNAESANPRKDYSDLLDLATTHGIRTRADDYPTLEKAADALHQEAALFSTS